MSIFGRSSQNAPSNSTASTRTVTPASQQDLTARLLSENNANSSRRATPAVAMTATKKSPLSFTPPSMNNGMSAANNGSNEVRKLIVGRDIAMAGEITACDYLVVEGTLDATMRDGQRIEINQTGLFRGAASVVEADIAGRFEGELSVSGRLRVRGSGKLSGRIQYGELEVEAGGQMQGELIALPPVAAEAPLTFSSAANSSAANDEPRTGTNG